MTVGTESEQKIWYLPKKVLTHCSPFFDAALNGNFAEASSKAVDLPEDDPDAFGIWATWLSLGNCDGSFQCDDVDQTYVRAWILGDKLGCPAFKDHVMSKCLCLIKHYGSLSLDTIHFAYEFPCPGSKMRQLFVEMFAWDKLYGYLTDADEIITFLRGLPEFSEDVVRLEVMAGGDLITRHPWEEQHRFYENPAFDPDD